jgi:hypothetical protein
VLPTNFLPDQPKSSSAGKKIRPLIYLLKRILMVLYNNGRRNMVGEKLIKQLKNQLFKSKSCCFSEKLKLKKSFQPFLSNQAKISPRFFQSLQNFVRPFCVLRLKFWPLGNTEICYCDLKTPQTR